MSRLGGARSRGSLAHTRPRLVLAAPARRYCAGFPARSRTAPRQARPPLLDPHDPSALR